MKKIRIIEPPGTRKSTHTANTIIGTSINSEPAVSRKRPFDNIEDDSSFESKEEKKQRPPRKKARIDVHALVFPELYDGPHQSCPKEKKSQPSASAASDEKKSPFIKPDIQASRYNIFPKSSGKNSRAAANNQRFLSQIRHQTSANDIS